MLLFNTVEVYGQHPILRSINFSGRENGVFIDLIIGGGNTCNGIMVYHRVSKQEPFSLVGEIGGICGDSETDTRYSFLHETPTPFDTNYYYLDFGGRGPSSVVPVYYLDYKDDAFIVLQRNGNIEVFAKAIDFIKAEAYLIDQNGSIVISSQLQDGFVRFSPRTSASYRYVFLVLVNEFGSKYVHKVLMGR